MEQTETFDEKLNEFQMSEAKGTVLSIYDDIAEEYEDSIETEIASIITLARKAGMPILIEDVASTYDTSVNIDEVQERVENGTDINVPERQVLENLIAFYQVRDASDDMRRVGRELYEVIFEEQNAREDEEWDNLTVSAALVWMSGQPTAFDSDKVTLDEVVEYFNVSMAEVNEVLDTIGEEYGIRSNARDDSGLVDHFKRVDETLEDGVEWEVYSDACDMIRELDEDDKQYNNKALGCALLIASDDSVDVDDVDDKCDYVREANSATVVRIGRKVGLFEDEE